ncbi:MAG: glycosyltransferase family 4 protein [Flavobacteriaceae bacterium]
MRKQINILYVGNDLTLKTGYNSTIAVLSKLLMENFQVKVVSNKQNKFQRLLDMCLTVIKRRNKTDYILIDTFSTSNFYFALIVSQLARLFNIKYIPILHGGNLPYRLERSKWLSNKIFLYSYANVAPSHYLKNAFQNKGFGVIFIPNILTISDYSFKSRKSIKPNLLWVRAFNKTYNPVMAIEVLNLLREHYPEAKLCMIGPFKDASYQDVLDRIKKYNLENGIEITGVLPRRKWLKKSAAYDVFINTTDFDNTPVSVMEAMALGLPIVSTNAGGLPFLIDDKNDGILVDKNDAKQMVKEIVKLLKNPLIAYKLAAEARKKAESFDWENVKQKWYRVIK